MTQFLAVSLHHARSPKRDLEMARRIAELCTRPCMSALQRIVMMELVKFQFVYYPPHPMTREHLVATLTDDRAYHIRLDDGQSDSAIEVSLHVDVDYHPESWGVRVPFSSEIIICYDPAAREETIATMLALAETLQAVFGYITFEPDYERAWEAANGEFSINTESERGPGKLMTPERMWYRNMPFRHSVYLPEQIGGPEWGTILGPGHMAALSLDELRASGAFQEVRELAHGGAFVRLSEDPVDTRSLAIVDMVARGREALAPICLNMDDIPVDLR